jgi:hypothetical protein
MDERAGEKRMEKSHPCVAVALAVMVSAFAACGVGERHGALEAGRSHLVSGSSKSPVSPRELSRARRAALAFARSYLASLSRPDSAAIRAAAPALARNLRALDTRLPSATGRRPARIVALGVVPRSRVRVEATAIFETGARFPISFDLRRIHRRWLAVRLAGN